jgi:HlyD family secretion protein
LKSVLSVPVQAIVQSGGDNYCYVDSNGRADRRHVKLGLSNDKSVEVRDGLADGDRVILNPGVLAKEIQRGLAEGSREAQKANPKEPPEIDGSAQQLDAPPEQLDGLPLDVSDLPQEANVPAPG